MYNEIQHRKCICFELEKSGRKLKTYKNSHLRFIAKNIWNMHLNYTNKDF